MITKDAIIEEIKKIQDPEIGIDIWTLGLIYSIDILDEKNVHILMTFTSPLCPAGGLLIGKVMEYLKDLGFEKVDVEITFEPAWQPSQELRALLGI
ncbi:MAG TPA: metal-sulfur cluster assembly factor [Bacteroidota bacterium]|nr:metal-sulfur cluster assembly factor [Bacteroidota bacterium]